MHLYIMSQPLYAVLYSSGWQLLTDQSIVSAHENKQTFSIKQENRRFHPTSADWNLGLTWILPSTILILYSRLVVDFGFDMEMWRNCIIIDAAKQPQYTETTEHTWAMRLLHSIWNQALLAEVELSYQQDAKNDCFHLCIHPTDPNEWSQ